MTYKKKTVQKKTKPYTFFKPLEWYALFYLDLGKGRSIATLASRVNALHPNEKHPSVETMRDWCKKNNWVKLAALHDKDCINLHPNQTFFTHTPNPTESLRMLEKMAILTIRTVTEMLEVIHNNPPSKITTEHINDVFQIAYMSLNLRIKYKALEQGDMTLALLGMMENQPERLRTKNTFRTFSA